MERKVKIGKEWVGMGRGVGNRREGESWVGENERQRTENGFFTGLERSGQASASWSNAKTIIIHLLGLAPAGYLAAPDNGPKAGCGVVHAKYPFGVTVVTLCH
jgi:hypothetical protein